MVAGITPPWCNIKNVTHCKDGDNFWNGKGNGDFFAGRGEKKPHQGMVRLEGSV